MSQKKHGLEAVQNGPQELQASGYFIQETRLGALEPLLWEAIHHTEKRRRASATSSISVVLKRLRLISKSFDVRGLSYGCLSTGDRGMFIFGSSASRIQAPMPEASAGASAGATPSTPKETLT